MLATSANPDTPARVPLSQIVVVFARISATSFGGGQMAAIRREVIRRNRWISEDQFLELLALGQLLPGANPVNVAVLVGSHLRGAAGAVAALTAAVVPGFAVLMLIGALAFESHAPWTRGALRACAAVAVGLTLANAIEMTLKRPSVIDLAIMAAVAAFVLVLHAPLALTLVVFIPVALLLTRAEVAA